MLLLPGCLGWPQVDFGPGKSSFDPERSAINPGTIGSVVPRWSTDIAGAEEAVLSGGRLHVLVADGTAPVEVRTFDAASGQQLWVGQMANSGVRGTGYVVVDGTRVRTGHYLTATECTASGFCFDHRYGQHMTFDAATGAELETPTPPSATEAPTRGAALSSRFLVFPSVGFETPVGGDPGASLIVVRRANPAIRSTVPLLGASTGPVVDDAAARVYDGTPVLQASGFGQCNPCQPWSFSDQGFLSAAALDETGLYVIDAFAGHLDALDPLSGTRLWTGTLAPASSGDPRATTPRPAVRHGTVYVMTADGLLQAFDDCGEAACAPLWTGTTTGTGPTPAVTGGLVYAAQRHVQADGTIDTVVAAYGWSGCARARCRPLAKLQASGEPLEVIAADDQIAVLTTAGLHVFGLQS
jgi:outer membrane protein assembly factor BamB